MRIKKRCPNLMAMVMMRNMGVILLTSWLTLIQGCKVHPGANTIDLAGDWQFGIDSLDRGVNERWYEKNLDDNIHLPGSMLTNRKGNEVTADTKWTGGIWDSTWYKSSDFAKYRRAGNVKVPFWLQPLKYYVGAAWYKRKVTIPQDWKNKYIELFFERCHWESTLWVDSQRVGMQNALSAPHVYNLSDLLTPGEHYLTLRVDNRIKDIDPGRDAHSVSDNTQTNWNGIIGKMTLTSRPPIYISDVQIYPDVDRKLVTARIAIGNLLHVEADCRITLSASPANAKTESAIAPLNKKVHLNRDSTVVELDYPMGRSPLLWDEFDPNLYTLRTEITDKAGSDSRDDDFGMKKFSVNGRQFRVNGRPIFLRGTLECAIFPKTGYPSVSTDDWLHIFGKCKEYGLNHVRFHSWCPPEAAFR